MNPPAGIGVDSVSAGDFSSKSHRLCDRNSHIADVLVIVMSEIDYGLLRQARTLCISVLETELRVLPLLS